MIMIMMVMASPVGISHWHGQQCVHVSYHNYDDDEDGVDDIDTPTVPLLLQVQCNPGPQGEPQL